MYDNVLYHTRRSFGGTGVRNPEQNGELAEDSVSNTGTRIYRYEFYRSGQPIAITSATIKSRKCLNNCTSHFSDPSLCSYG
jgi:hypothetical protein